MMNTTKLKIQQPLRIEIKSFIQKLINSRLFIIQSGITNNTGDQYLYNDANRILSHMQTLRSDNQFANFIIKEYDSLRFLIIKNKSYHNQIIKLERLSSQAHKQLNN